MTSIAHLEEPTWQRGGLSFTPLNRGSNVVYSLILRDTVGACCELAEQELGIDVYYNYVNMLAEMAQRAEDIMSLPTKPDEGESAPPVSVSEKDGDNEEKQNKDKSHRIQITVKPSYFDQIEKLREQRGSPSISRVIRDGITLLKVHQREIKAGRGIYLRESDGTFVRLEIL